MARPEYTARRQAARAVRTGGMRLRSATKRSISAWHAAGGADERLAGEVLLVAGLLADQHHARAAWALAEHRLRTAPPQRAATARRGRRAQRRQRAALRQEVRRGAGGGDAAHATLQP